MPRDKRSHRHDMLPLQGPELFSLLQERHHQQVGLGASCMHQQLLHHLRGAHVSLPVPAVTTPVTGTTTTH
jgi:hypothetical protein